MTEGLGYTLADMCMYVCMCVCVCVCVCRLVPEPLRPREQRGVPGGSGTPLGARAAAVPAAGLPQCTSPSLLVSDVAPTALHCITM
jgi:hypothetical protein